jgi:hypothetical protein
MRGWYEARDLPRISKGSTTTAADEGLLVALAAAAAVTVAAATAAAGVMTGVKSTIAAHA